MKRLSVLLAVVLMLSTAVSASAEGVSMDLFSLIRGQLFEFSSGVGAWSTELTILEDGTFTGNYHDSEMGETGEGYPNGTLYGCTFHGKLSDAEPVDEYSWKAKITVEQDEGQVPEAIEDDIRYVTAAPYGLEKAQTVIFFLPGMPVNRLPEGFILWSHLQEIDPDAKVIPYYAIWNEEDEAGFITYPVSEEAGLPAYAYTGEDPIEGAVADYLAADERAREYLTEPGYVTIPCPIIHKTEMTDDTHSRVYGTFWILNYVRKGDILECISGGEYPAIILLENVNGEWCVTSMEEAGDGDDYSADIQRFANGDQELENKYYAASDLGTPENREIRSRFVRNYVERNNLAVTAYQDYGWDPIELN